MAHLPPKRNRNARLLRALNDLKYERSVGKISEDDYAELSQRYREQAKRLMQQLEGEQEPARKRAEQLLQRRLVKAGLLPETKKRKKAKAAAEEAASTATGLADEKAEAKVADRADAESAPEATKTNGKSSGARRRKQRRCPGCESTNDLDARFCKHCGKSLADEGETFAAHAPRPSTRRSKSVRNAEPRRRPREAHRIPVWLRDHGPGGAADGAAAASR